MIVKWLKDCRDALRPATQEPVLLPPGKLILCFIAFLISAFVMGFGLTAWILTVIRGNEHEIPAISIMAFFLEFVFLMIACATRDLISLHYIAAREANGTYPLLTVTGVRLKDKNGVYFTRGCRVSYLFYMEGTVIGISNQPPHDGAWHLVIKTKSGKIDADQGMVSVIQGGMTEDEWRVVRQRVPRAKRGAYRI